MTVARSSILLTELGVFAEQASHPASRAPVDPLSQQVTAAGTAAVAHARRRLATRLPTQALRAADQYFAAPDVNPWDGGSRPEPGADVRELSPARRSSASDENPAIELRPFDRKYPRWAPFADDVAAVTGADVVLELLVADGERTAGEPKAGWRRDGSDALITVVDGAERFAVASTEPPDAEPEPELDTVLRAGDTLRLPRTMLHSARPAAGGSALLSMKLRRAPDWSLRHSAPRHLGFRDYPCSARVYRLCLRSHVPAGFSTPFAGWDPATTLLRTRTPGGLAVLAVRGTDVTFVAAGAVYRSSRLVLRVLAGIHEADGIRLAEVAERAGLARRTTRTAVDALIANGLVRIDALVGNEGESPVLVGPEVRSRR